MPRKTSTPTSPWAAIDALVRSNPEPTGPEWFTAAQYMERYGGAHAAVHRKLSADPRFEKWTGLGASARRTITKFRLK